MAAGCLLLHSLLPVGPACVHPAMLVCAIACTMFAGPWVGWGEIGKLTGGLLGAWCNLL